MPWNARLQLPALVLLAVPAGAVLATASAAFRAPSSRSSSSSRRCRRVLVNSSRPLVGVCRRQEKRVVRAVLPHAAPSIFATSRWEDYFRGRPALQGEVEDVMRAVGRRCGPGESVRLDLADGAWEYALWAGARRYAPGVRLGTGALLSRGCRPLRGHALDVPRRPALLPRRGGPLKAATTTEDEGRTDPGCRRLTGRRVSRPALLLAAGLLARLALARRAPVAGDGVRFLAQARDLAAGSRGSRFREIRFPPSLPVTRSSSGASAGSAPGVENRPPRAARSSRS